MPRGWIVAFGGAVAVAVGWVIGDSVREFRDERAISRFNLELNTLPGFPRHWRMRP